MWKKYKTTLILTTLISLFPMVIGLLLWNRMPDTIATHFGTNNVPNGWSSKTMAVIGIPLFLAALQIFTAVLTAAPSTQTQSASQLISVLLAMGLSAFSLFSSAITCQNANRTTQPASRFHGPFTVRKTGTALTASPAGFGSSAALP